MFLRGLSVPCTERISLAVMLFFLLALDSPAIASPVAAPDDAPDDAAVTSEASTNVSFARQILPILSNKCFACHGPDADAEGNLRLDSFDSATALRDTGNAINPEAVQESLLLQRIQSADDPMPPADAEKQLTEPERQLLVQWIQQGGAYELHWAFVAPVKKQIDPQSLANHSPIDHFIHNQLQIQGLDFAPPADRSTLARRASLVLTGLPPEPEQLARFLADSSDGAYDKLLDDLFASPRFGEHQARYWLDAVRYGDTHGLHLDNRRGIYPYRDWVVRAFNQNLPLNDFILWQVAGDLLPDPTLEQLTATGFVRMNPSTGEGGAIPDEFQAKNNFDRTETLGTVLLGLSLTCARCHTHKYDPIRHDEYYGLLAFFNSTAESPLDGNSYTYGNTIKVPKDQADWDQWESMRDLRSKTIEQSDLRYEDADALAAMVQHARSRILTLGNWQRSPVVPATDIEKPDQPWHPSDDLASLLKDQKLKQGEAVWLSADVESPVEQQVFLNLQGSRDSQVWVDQQRVAIDIGTEIGNQQVDIPVTFPQGKHTLLIRIVADKAELALLCELRNPWTELAASGQWHTLPVATKFLLLADPLSPHFDEGLARNAQGLRQYDLLMDQNFTTTLVARELPNPRTTRVLKRGEYDMPIGDPLVPDVPSILGRLPVDAPKNRLGLASWLIDRDHPLVARVLVNQMWQRAFGYGLVRTPEDFGLQGEQPTHPELLDWLAVDLHDTNWDQKRMLRLMLSSRTFQQDSSFRDDFDDPENRFWGRGPSYRLDAEVIRDTGLWASKLLDGHLGGEGVKPYQPEGMWRALAHPGSNTKQYVQDQGDLLYRRSLYVYWKRTSPHPMMTLFDAPDRETSCVRRSRTSTSLQSLGLFNETQRIEMGRKLAERLLTESDSDRSRFEKLFTLVASRGPSEIELQACEKLLTQLFDRYANAEAEANALLAVGAAPRNANLDPSSLAAWTQVCVTVLASDISILLY